MTDYKTQLHEAITEMQAATKRGELPRELRLVKIEVLTEDYFAKTGKIPDDVSLERLADLCLHEELFDPSLTKMQDEEYPVMSDRQYDRRQNMEFATGDRMEQNAADGKEHGSPVRRNRSEYENRFVDKKARIRNKERQRTYNEFTKVHPVIRQHLSDLTDYR